MRKQLLIVAVVAVVAGTALGQNLLVNSSFTASPIDPVCSHRDQPTAGSQVFIWDKTNPSWDPINWAWYYAGSATGWAPTVNGSYYIPPCPADGTYANWQVSGGRPEGRISQTVTLPVVADGTTAYLYTGKYHMGTSVSAITDAAVVNLGIDEGDTPVDLNNPIPFSKWSISRGVRNGEMNGWFPLSLVSVPAAGTTKLTVSISSRTGSAAASNYGVAVDDFSLVAMSPSDCVNQPVITASDYNGTPSISPLFAARGSTFTMTLTGKNFAGSPTLTLRQGPGGATLAVSSVTVVSSTQVTASITVAPSSPVGIYDIIYQQGTCGEVSFPMAFLVYVSSLTNPSFELPAGAACTPLEVTPADWLTGESNGWGAYLRLNGFWRDGTLAFVPTCPSYPDVVRGGPASGNQYGTMASSSGGGSNCIAYQTFGGVTAFTKYTISGYFAGSGDNTVKLRLKKGTSSGAVITEKTIHNGTNDYDWQFDFVDGSGTGVMNQMTFEWAVSSNGGNAQKATHADMLVMETCSTPFTGTLTGITPNVAATGGVLHVTNLAGTGLASTQSYFLNGPGKQIPATNVVWVSSTQVTCDFDLAGAPVGNYSLLLKQGGCYASSAYVPYAPVPWTVYVGTSQFVNGDFELPAATMNCGPPPSPVGGLPTGWKTDSSLNRDGNAPMPPSCPSPAGGNYGTLASPTGTTQRAWQTMIVQPGQRYTFAGQFSGTADCVIQLMDGFENGTVIGTPVTVFTGGDAGSWHSASVSGLAASSVMTAMWIFQNTTTVAPGGHGDGLTFGLGCHTAWADADNDGDVDMDDFAIWQLCYTGGGGAIPANPVYCTCFDRAAPVGTVDDADLALFLQCMSGPSVPWTACNP